MAEILYKNRVLDTLAKQMLSTIDRHAGMNFMTLVEWLEVPENTLRYRIMVLEQEGYITTVKEGKRMKLFLTGRGLLYI
jgi:predicted transcriptional regulator